MFDLTLNVCFACYKVRVMFYVLCVTSYVLRLTFYVLRSTCYVLCFACYVLCVTLTVEVFFCRFHYGDYFVKYAFHVFVDGCEHGVVYVTVIVK